ncbi:hypothetical protein LPJ64_003221 [Coemansia asiatica]|uniref:Uncharacterized protein n=1 Tax=Coemansia asiatica TaxID=1052880 RepID=A0A9W7XKJ5_9FUNG|nr:hypothetical protein LPJ64_003221 [Coemansia asiatica]
MEAGSSMDSSRATPVASRNCSPAELAESIDSPLGILAAIASPSPTIKTQPVSLASTLLANASSSSISQIDNSNGNENRKSSSGSPVISNVEPAAFKAPQLTSISPKTTNGTNSESASPPASPSSQAALRKDSKDSSSASNESTASASSGTTANASSSLAAIPATQLDVLALVTATSPPMPSRRRWVLHSTPKPLTAGANDDVNTPVRNGKNGNTLKNSNSPDSGSDTVSEDELTLRSYSARIRSRHYNLQPRLIALPAQATSSSGDAVYRHGIFEGNSAGAGAGAGAGVEPGKPLFASAQARRKNPSMFATNGFTERHPSVSARAPRYKRRELGNDSRSRSNAMNVRSDNDNVLAKTDDEMPSNRKTPTHICRSAQRHPENQLAMEAIDYPQAIHVRNRAGSVSDREKLPPASEPSLNGRSRRHIPNGIQGSVLSKQLSQLVEDEGEAAGHSGEHANSGVPSRYSSLSISPPPSPSQRQHRRSKRIRSGRSTMLSGSETETDTELATRQLASGAETDRSAASRYQNGSLHARITPEFSGLAAYPRPPFNARRAGINDDRGPIYHNPPYHYHDNHHQQQQQQNQLRKRRHQDAQIDSEGDTTETDEEFFGPSRALHSSIRPPRRVVRQLASLRARNVQPTALDLSAHRQPVAYYANYSELTSPVEEAFSGSHYPYQTHTAPATGIPHAESGASMGLGISSAAGQPRDAQNIGAPRVLSTPSLVAGQGISGAIRNGANQRSYAPPLPEAHIQEQQQQQQQQQQRQRGYSSHYQHQQPVADEFTYKGAALRRLEKSHARGSTGGGGGGGTQGSFVSRKRALTAPSTLDPPLRKRGQYGPNGRLLNSTASLLEDENEEDGYSGNTDGQVYGRTGTASVGASGSNTPNGNGYGYYKQRQHYSGNGRAGQSYALGASPMSSLRSSLVSRIDPPRDLRLYSPSSQNIELQSTRLSFESLRSDNQTLGACTDSLEVASSAVPGSPSMDAALRQTRRRQGSSGISAAARQSQSPSVRTSSGFPHASNHQHTSQIGGGRSGPNVVATVVTTSPRNDILFPPIDSNQ